MNTQKICFSCKYCYIDSGHPSYSEVTPEDPMKAECRKNHWKLHAYDYTRKDWYNAVTKATTCPDYEQSLP